MANHYNTRDLQSCALQNLLAVDKVCREHNIRYYISDGTMLGAVRHGGFIPWDDDLDIVMPRPDYIRFIQHANEWLSAPYEMVCPDNIPTYPGVFAKVIDGSTTLIERWSFHQLGGVYIDVFPLDGVPSNRILRRLQLSAYKAVERWIYLRNRDPYKRGHGLSSWLPLFIQAIVSNAKLQRLMHRIQTMCDYEKAALVAEFDDDERGVMSKDVFGKPTPVIFEGHEVLGPEKVEQYLTHLFGDYMQLPPEEKRRIHNFDYVDFEHSYHDYNDTRVFK